MKQSKNIGQTCLFIVNNAIEIIIIKCSQNIKYGIIFLNIIFLHILNRYIKVHTKLDILEGITHLFLDFLINASNSIEKTTIKMWLADRNHISYGLFWQLLHSGNVLSNCREQ